MLLDDFTRNMMLRACESWPERLSLSRAEVGDEALRRWQEIEPQTPDLGALCDRLLHRIRGEYWLPRDEFGLLGLLIQHPEYLPNALERLDSHRDPYVFTPLQPDRIAAVLDSFLSDPDRYRLRSNWVRVALRAACQHWRDGLPLTPDALTQTIVDEQAQHYDWPLDFAAEVFAHWTGGWQQLLEHLDPDELLCMQLDLVCGTSYWLDDQLPDDA